MNRKKRKVTGAAETYLEGQLLLAMPTMTDKRFRRAVIFLCRHSADGAMGLVVNHRAKDLTLSQLAYQLDLVTEADTDAMPTALRDKAVLVGGPVSAERGFVLHSADYCVDDTTLSIGGDICLTASVDILKAIMTGHGPRDSVLALGYAGWAPGQLEGEIQANGWLHCPADKELVFGPDIDLTYDRALSRIGVDPSFLASEAGHA